MASPGVVPAAQPGNKEFNWKRLFIKPAGFDAGFAVIFGILGGVASGTRTGRNRQSRGTITLFC
jgi:hypothetical protein